MHKKATPPSSVSAAQMASSKSPSLSIQSAKTSAGIKYFPKTGEFTATAAADVVGVTRRAVIDWGGRSLVGADIRPSQGRGTNRLYSAGNLVQMAVVKALFEHGLTRDQVKALVGEAETAIFDPDAARQPGTEWLVVVDGARFILVHEAAEMRLPAASWLLWLNLTEIKQKVISTIA